jgi:hypothetical protein
VLAIFEGLAPKEGHNLGHSFPVGAWNLLKVQGTLVDSQSSNPGSIPGSANSYHPLSRVISAAFLFVPKRC